MCEYRINSGIGHAQNGRVLNSIVEFASDYRLVYTYGSE